MIAMQTDQAQEPKQYARVARIIPKIHNYGTNARIRTLSTNTLVQI